MAALHSQQVVKLPVVLRDHRPGTPRKIRDILPPELPDGAVMYRAVGGKDIGAGTFAAHCSLQAPAAGQLPEEEFRHRAAADIARTNK